MRSVVLHSHFYQPPREDPWFGEIEREADAEPYRDWTTRVAHECYRGIVAARVLDGEGRVRRVVNALAHTSFDVGPSLLAWLERHMPNAYAAVLAADAESARRLGHGNALAHPYDHIVLPLASRRDKATAVRWGIADFARRFGRAPEGMWLPETAVDDETLDVLAEQGIRFTILAPHQVTDAPADGAPGRYTTANGREIALCAYDGTLAHEIAFGGLLRDGRKLAESLAAGDDDTRLVAVATDGETYGHHHRFGDMALAAAVDVLERHPRARLENFASFLARRPAEQPVGIVAPSAWSCSHGVDRWRRECGCVVEPGSHQRWRAPLREAIDGLVADAHALFEDEGAALFGDPWGARDAYEAGDGASAAAFDAAGDARPDGREVRARELLEMERHALLAQTSCAWFFDDVARPEPLIVLRAAARVIELAGARGGELEARLLERLGRAESNDASARTARDLYVQRARPARPPAVRVAAGFAAVRRFGVRGAELPSAWSGAVVDEGHLVRLVERRTGRSWTFDVLVDVPGSASAPHHERFGRGSAEEHAAAAAAEGAEHGEHPERATPFRLSDVDPRAITVLVRPMEHDGALEAAPLGTALKLADLPQRARRAVERALRRAVVHRLLDADEREQLAAGEAELGHLVSSALRRAVRALAADTSPPAIARVLGLADLRESLRGIAPFDAQTAFHEIRAAASPEAAARLAPVARRLGFSPRAWEASWSERPGPGTRDSGLATITAAGPPEA